MQQKKTCTNLVYLIDKLQFSLYGKCSMIFIPISTWSTQIQSGSTWIK